MTEQEAIAILGRCETCGRAANHTHNPEILEAFRTVTYAEQQSQVKLDIEERLARRRHDLIRARLGLGGDAREAERRHDATLRELVQFLEPTWPCIDEGCTGEMVATGEYQATTHPRWFHRCNVCEQTSTALKKYPERIEEPSK